MTTIKYYPSEYRMEILGHAGFAPAGQDIVCAGISTLAMTLIETATDEPEFCTAIFIDHNGAEMKVESDPNPGYEDICKAVYDTVFKGFKTVEESYPNHVKAIGG